MERKPQEFGVSSAVIKEYRRDIFGDPQQLELGLVDVNSETELDSKILGLEEKWNNYEMPFHSPPEFHTWFMQHGREVIARSMLRPIREKAGLGSSPGPYYTNDIESKNNIIKQHIHCKSSHLPEFVENMKTLMFQQRSEIEKAVATYGEYRVISKYSNFAYDHHKWFKMTEQQRKNKLCQFMKAPVILPPQNDPNNSTSSDQVTPLDDLMLPPNMASTIWSCANIIIEDNTAIVNAPGDETSYNVKSLSGQRPHYVRPSKGGGFLCDDCLGYKSAKICAHTVAASLKTGNIRSFISWYIKLKCKPNFTVLAESGKPAATGKKPRKGVSKKVSQRIHAVLDTADESDFSSRIPSDTINVSEDEPRTNFGSSPQLPPKGSRFPSQSSHNQCVTSKTHTVNS